MAEQASNESIVLITSADEENTSFGTGFVIYRQGKKSFIITCAHVIEKVGSERIKVNNSNEVKLITSLDEEIDLAVLEVSGLDDAQSKAVLRIGNFESEDGRVEVRGFSRRGQNKKQFEIRSLDCVIHKKVRRRTKQLVDAWDLKFEGDSLKSGYSGSPVLAGECVIGVVDSREASGKMGHAISIFELLKIWPRIPSDLRDVFLEYSTGREQPLIPFTNRDTEVHGDQHRCVTAFLLHARDLIRGLVFERAEIFDLPEHFFFPFGQ